MGTSSGTMMASNRHALLLLVAFSVAGVSLGCARHRATRCSNAGCCCSSVYSPSFQSNVDQQTPMQIQSAPNGGYETKPAPAPVPTPAPVPDTPAPAIPDLDVGEPSDGEALDAGKRPAVPAVPIFRPASRRRVLDNNNSTNKPQSLEIGPYPPASGRD